jgi:hypothetical protein
VCQPLIAASQPRSLAASQPRSLAASQPRSLAASQPRSLAASQPRGLFHTVSYLAFQVVVQARDWDIDDIRYVQVWNRCAVGVAYYQWPAQCWMTQGREEIAAPYELFIWYDPDQVVGSENAFMALI